VIRALPLLCVSFDLAMIRVGRNMHYTRTLSNHSFTYVACFSCSELLHMHSPVIKYKIPIIRVLICFCCLVYVST